MTPVPYEPTAGVLDKKLLSLLYRARDGEKGLMPEYDKVFAEYEAAITSGWVDWEGDIERRLTLLRHWCQRADAGTTGGPRQWLEVVIEEGGFRLGLDPKTAGLGDIRYNMEPARVADLLTTFDGRVLKNRWSTMDFLKALALKNIAKVYWPSMKEEGEFTEETKNRVRDLWAYLPKEAEANAR